MGALVDQAALVHRPDSTYFAGLAVWNDFNSYPRTACAMEVTRSFIMAAKRKTRSYKVWTPDDLKTLKKHGREKTPVVKIARLMKRSEPTIRQKAYLLGISVGHQRRAA
jgi:hypothetical protein